MKEKIKDQMLKLFTNKGFYEPIASFTTHAILGSIEKSVLDNPKALKQRLDEISIVCGQAANQIPPFKT
jgi:hypothetical protein